VSLRSAVLVTLLDGGASGYELSKRFDVSVANYWAASSQQLYRELDRMEADGVVEAELVEQERRPNKRVFSITAAGREELTQLTRQAPRPAAIRDAMLVQVAADDVADADAVLRNLEQRGEHARGKLALYARLRDRLLAGRSEEEFLRGAERVGPYLALARGISLEEDDLAWTERCIAVLRARSEYPTS
jgi:DNA-binding PadR family transcriptional regulator